MPHLSRDGTHLFVVEAGRGDPPLVLVHGWCCDHTFLQPQFDHFSGRHRVVALDQRGHGQSDTPEQEYRIEGFADDLAWLCRELGLTKPVVIGHSMGGMVALELARSFPEIPAAIAALESPVVPRLPLVDLAAPIIEGLRSPAYRDVQRQFIANSLFIPSDDPGRCAQIQERMARTPQHVMRSAFEHLITYDSVTAAAACPVPFLYIGAAEPVTDMPRLRELCPRAVTGQTVGVGHFHQLEAPDQVNAMLERFLASLP